MVERGGPIHREYCRKRAPNPAWPCVQIRVAPFLRLGGGQRGGADPSSARKNAVVRVRAARGAGRRAAATLCGVVAAAALISACGGSASSTHTAAKHPTSLAAQGRLLYASEGCEDCHSLDGTPDTGPSWKGLYGSRVHLTSGRTVIATAAYLTKHIVDPDAMTVSGFPGGVMAEAIQSDALASKPADVRALVAFIEQLK
jgi:cytochrome c1